MALSYFYGFDPCLLVTVTSHLKNCILFLPTQQMTLVNLGFVASRMLLSALVFHTGSTYFRQQC